MPGSIAGSHYSRAKQNNKKTFTMTVATILYAISLLTVTVSMCQAVQVNLEKNATESVTCEAGNFTIEEEASVTCHFNSDLKTTKQNFNVVKYPLKTSDESGAETYILLCNWDSAGDLACKVEDGYIFSREVSTELTLTIPKVTLESEGLYVCQIVPTNSVLTETCILRIITEEKSDDHEGPGRTTIIIASLSTVSGVSVCLLIICAACCGYILNKCYLVRKMKQTTNVQDAPDNRTPPAAGNDIELEVRESLVSQAQVEMEPETTRCCNGLIYKKAYKEGVLGGQKIVYLNKFIPVADKQTQTGEKDGKPGEKATKPSIIQRLIPF